MTTTTLRETRATPSIAAPTPPEARGSAQRVLSYLGSTLRLSLTDGGFIGFIIAMPTAMYLFFSTLYGDEIGGAEIQRHIMVMMATYGAMGSALAAGNAIQNERATGWFRQLMLTALSPTQFFFTRLLAALLLILPPIVVVLGVGAIDGVRLPLATWASVVGVALVVLIPFVVMGLVVGLWLKPQAANAATTFLMLALAMLGGMWVPLDQMPQVLQDIGILLPSYWAGQFALTPITGDPVAARGVITLVAWTVGLAALGVVGYRRAVATSKR
ncbi:MAG: ABC transporter permease [Propionibacterium sp.]|nr:ABC transporter permease [Propionibacterium sp.]